jgi:large conductance mechanosensitive channel
MFKEFKEFAFKGNVLDLAIGVIIGAAFGKIVTALVDVVIMPIISIILSLILNDVNIATWQFSIGATPIMIGVLIKTIIEFLIIAFVLFLFVKGINATRRKQEVEAPAAPPPSEEVLLLREIRDSLQK